MCCLKVRSLFIKELKSRDADNMAFGSLLSNDKDAGRGFEYLIANPVWNGLEAQGTITEVCNSGMSQKRRQLRVSADVMG